MFGSLTMTMLFDAQAQELENQLLDNQQDLRLKSKYATNSIEEIQFEFTQQKELLKEQTKNPDEMDNDEYKELLAQINELSEIEEQEIAKIETAYNQQEEDVQMENAELEVRLEDIKAEKEASEQITQDHVEEDFGYFN